MTVLSRLLSKFYFRSEPAVPSRREHLEESLVGDLKDELQKRKRFVDPEMDTSIQSYSQQLQSYSTDTLELVYASFHGSGKLTNVIETTDEEEENFRAAANFWEVITFNFISGQMFQHVRESTGFSDLGAINNASTDYARVAAVLVVAKDAHTKRYTESVWSNNPELQASRDGQDIYMTPDIAQVIMGHHDRTQDIIDYICDRYTGVLEKVDVTELRLYLDSPAQALSKGML